MTILPDSPPGTAVNFFLTNIAEDMNTELSDAGHNFPLPKKLNSLPDTATPSTPNAHANPTYPFCHATPEPTIVTHIAALLVSDVSTPQQPYNHSAITPIYLPTTFLPLCSPINSPQTATEVPLPSLPTRPFPVQLPVLLGSPSGRLIKQYRSTKKIVAQTVAKKLLGTKKIAKTFQVVKHKLPLDDMLENVVKANSKDAASSKKSKNTAGSSPMQEDPVAPPQSAPAAKATPIVKVDQEGQPCQP